MNYSRAQFLKTFSNVYISIHVNEGRHKFIPSKNQVYTHLKCCEDVNLEPTCVTCKMNGFSEKHQLLYYSSDE